MRDKAILIGLLAAVGALAERLTGERLEVGIVDENGNRTWFYASPLSYRWISPRPIQGEALDIASSDQTAPVPKLESTQNG
jgi:hypothetical protein